MYNYFVVEFGEYTSTNDILWNYDHTMTDRVLSYAMEPFHVEYFSTGMDH